jgi:transcriptional regulator with XRE-family HTH domain
MNNLETTTQGGRLQFVLNALNLNQIELATQLNTTKATISRFVNNKKPISAPVLHRLKLLYPALNTEWLKNNVGTAGLDSYIRITREEQYISKISNLQSEIDRLKIEINQLKNQLNEKDFNRPLNMHHI